MAKAPVVTELPLQSVRFLFGTMVDLRMLPQVLEQTGRAEVGEFKLVAHFPEQEKVSGNEAGYMTRHKGFRGGDYNTYHGDPYTLDEINWDATGRAGVHLVTKTKYGQTVEFPTIPDKNDTSELMLIVSEYVESIKTPPLIVRCSGIGGTISPLGNKKYALSLSTGATKCPTSIKDHVPKKYHAEDMDVIPYVGGAEIFSAEDLSPAQQEFIGQQIARQMQGYYRTGVIGIEPVIGAFPNGPMSIAKRTPEAKQDFFREPAVQDEDGFWNKGPNRWQAHKIAKGVAYDQLERAQSRGTMLSAEEFAAEKKLMCAECDDYFNACGCGTKKAEHFAAVSTAAPNLKREKTNLRSAIRDEIDSNFEYSQCVWGPYALRMEGATTNKFYMVFVYDNGNGVFRALGGYGGLAQNPRLFDVMTTRDQSAAIAAATRKLKAKERKGYFTYKSEEGSTPVMDPMEFGEMANWTPMDGSEGLKRKRAESVETYSGGSYGTIMTFGEIAYEYDYDNAPMIFEEDYNFDTWLKSSIRDTGRGEGEDTFEYAFTVEDEEKNETYTMDHPIYVKWTHEYSDFNTAETGTYAAESNFSKLAQKISMQYQDKGKSKEEADEIGRRTAYTIGAKKYGKRGMTRKAMAGRKSAEDDYGFSGLVGAYAEYLEERCGNHWQAFQEEYYEDMDAEDIPVWNDGIVQWETSGSMSPTGSGYSSASAPPTGVIAGPGDTFLNYTEAQNYLVETSGGLWGAEHFEAMARIDPKNAQDVANVKKALKQRYKGIKINRVEYITNRRGASNKYHVFAFTNRGVFNGYGRIGKTMTIFGPMSESEGQKKMGTKMRRGGYKEQV